MYRISIPSKNFINILELSKRTHLEDDSIFLSCRNDISHDFFKYAISYTTTTYDISIDIKENTTDTSNEVSFDDLIIDGDLIDFAFPDEETALYFFIRCNLT